jgi:glutathione peroxidase-family protein
VEGSLLRIEIVLREREGGISFHIFIEIEIQMEMEMPLVKWVSNQEKQKRFSLGLLGGVVNADVMWNDDG